ncbi:MAG: hypothetical protein EPO25_15770 [Gammaproteobacteria bacterium]|nr:MAG: hypothetical protein EPO25_15770 [Gammaproteobacteria bacterium]
MSANIRWLVTVASIAAAAPLTSTAYELAECAGIVQRWGGSSVIVRAASTSFPADSVWRTALQETVDGWNRNPSQMSISLRFGDDSVSFGNFENEIWFTSDDTILDGAPARASMIYSCTGSMLESDVFIDSRISLTTSSAKTAQTGYGGGARSFQTLAGHELGHTLGLLHTRNTYNIMGQDARHVHTNGSAARFYPGEDAGNGIVALYGVRSSIQDLGVVHWRHSGWSGEYSSHSRTRMFNSAGQELASDTINGERHYRVTRGQTVKVEFSFENNGAARQRSADVGFYISTNDYITTGDWRIGGRTLDLGRNTISTIQSTVTVLNDLNTTVTCPNSTLRGCYWVGAVVDEDGSLTEINEANNATYVGIRVLP